MDGIFPVSQDFFNKPHTIINLLPIAPCRKDASVRRVGSAYEAKIYRMYLKLNRYPVHEALVIVYTCTWVIPIILPVQVST